MSSSASASKCKLGQNPPAKSRSTISLRLQHHHPTPSPPSPTAKPTESGANCRACAVFCFPGDSPAANSPKSISLWHSDTKQHHNTQHNVPCCLQFPFCISIAFRFMAFYCFILVFGVFAKRRPVHRVSTAHGALDTAIGGYGLRNTVYGYG